VTPRARWGDSCDLAGRAWSWSLVTVPAISVLTIIVGSVVDTASWDPGGPSAGDIGTAAGGSIVVIAFLDIVAAVLGFGWALVALPFTHLLELATRTTVGPRTRAVLHACLAGVLACVPAAFASEAFSVVWLAPLAVAAGTAAALAGRGAERQHRIDALEARPGAAAAGTTPGREIPTGPPPSLQNGELA
jgi:hypothetical protein